jgi:hypothetical protein
MSFAVPARFGDDVDASPRLARILKLGEVVTRLAGLGQAFAAKTFPGEDSDPVDIETLPDLLEKAISSHDEQLRSAARGGAKIALALTKAWYPEADIRQLTEYMPSEDENGEAIELPQVLAAVQGYATRVANMVDIRKFFKEHPDPHMAAADPPLADPEDDGDEEDEAAAADGSPQDGGNVAAESSPQDGGASPRVVDASPQVLPAAPSDPANS